MMEFAKDAQLVIIPREVFQAVTIDQGDLGYHTFRCMRTNDGTFSSKFSALCHFH
jgi:hypothetical protein